MPPTQYPTAPARPPTRIGANPSAGDAASREKGPRWVDGTIYFPQPELTLFPAARGAGPKPIPPEKVREKLWNMFGGQQLVWDKRYKQAFEVDVTSEASTIAASQSSESSSSRSSVPFSDEAKEFLAEIGLSSIPFLRSGVAVGKLVKEVVSAVMTYHGKGKAVDFSDPNSKAAAFEQIAVQGLAKTLDRALTRNKINIGTYTYDVVTSFVDFTGLSGVPSAGIRLAEKLYYTYTTKKLVKEVNKELALESDFSVSLFTRMPLLGCYLLDTLDASELMGIFDAYDSGEIDAAGRARSIGFLARSDREAIAAYEKKMSELKVLARGRIETSAYGLGAELERRDRGGVAGRVKDNLPSILKPKSKDKDASRK